MRDLAIIFDLDGTLIDSAPDIHAAAARMLRDEGRAPLPFQTVRSFIGNGVPVLVERIIAATGLDPADHPRLTAAFLRHYEADPTALTRPYPGVVEALRALSGAGAALGVCTNKPEAPTRQILARLDLEPFFGVVVGGDGPAGTKPAPAGLLGGFAALDRPRRIYVGDSEVDAETARRAGVAFALFTEGYRKLPVAALPHAVAFSDFARLPELAQGAVDATA